MPLPVYLSPGMISVYGQGSVWGLFNPIKGNTTQFGIIDQINTVPAQLAIGTSVMFDSRNIESQIQYQNVDYYILNGNRVIATEYVYNINIIPPP